MRRQVWAAVKFLAVMTVLTGLAYPLLVTGIAQSIFPEQANGSLIETDSDVFGSRLLDPRPPEVGYDPTSSSGSNLGPTNPELVEMVGSRVEAYRRIDGLARGTPVPVDAVTTSASGLDPHISVANASLQAPRVAEARDVNPKTVIRLIEAATINGGNGVFEMPAVKVLVLNISLEEASP